MYDANAVLQALVTKTATFNSTGLRIYGTPVTGAFARFLVPSYISAATAGTVFTFTVEESDDDSTYTTLAGAPPITGATTAGSTEIIIPFNTKKEYVRSKLTVSSAAGTPSISYSVEYGNSRGR